MNYVMSKKEKKTKKRNASSKKHGAMLQFKLLRYVIFIVVLGIVYYTQLPAINIHSSELYCIVIGLIAAIYAISRDDWWSGHFSNGKNEPMKKSTKVVLIIMGAIGIIWLVGQLISSPIFNAKRYASLIQVEEGTFTEDIVEQEDINDIALMDTQTAQIIGERAIGSLADVVSQYEVGTYYSTMDYNGVPMKATTLEYADFFKWLNNRSHGVPGYVLVDPVNNEANYVELNQPIKYSLSGYFNDNLVRHLRFQYPTAMFEGYYFELDPEGNPYYVCPVLTARIGLFGGYDVKGIVLCDPCTGDSTYYAVAEVPQWVDRVYDGALAQQKYDWYGTLSGGYINSLIGNKGCKVTTEDYGYKVMNGDVWVYTGVTSVNGDQSNIGFVMINLRTCECKYYQVAGAEEFSAMSSAEGQVQHLGYQASFPSLINIGGQPTYIMVLKDNSGLVKMYAMVNVEKYNIVATGNTQKEALSAYRKLMAENGLGASVEEDEAKSRKITIADIQYIGLNGSTFVYIKDTNGGVYKQSFEENESLILLSVEDRITVYYEEGEQGIYQLLRYKR